MGFYLTWVTFSAMLRPSISVGGFTDTALHTTEQPEGSLLLPKFLFLSLKDIAWPTQACFKVREESAKISDLELQREGVSGLIRAAEAAAIVCQQFLLFFERVSSLTSLVETWEEDDDDDDDVWTPQNSKMILVVVKESWFVSVRESQWIIFNF